MAKQATRATSRIKAMCKASGFEEKELYKRAKLLLEIYRDICWSSTLQAEETKQNLFDYSMEYCSNDLDSALIYLETFAPDEGRERFEAKIRSLFEVRWMMEIVESTMVKVKNCPINGELYCSILSAYYLGNFMYMESEMLDLLGLERSTFYRRKKEAIMVFGISLWGKSLIEIRNNAIVDNTQMNLWDCGRL